MYRHLLVPTDGSDLSIETVGKAVEFARTLGARITFFSARHDYGATDDGALERTLNPGGFIEHAAGEARGYVAQAEAEARMKKVPCQSIVYTADRHYKAILEAAERYGCDLIFMSSHGRRGLRSWLHGSETQKVVTHSTVPVLVNMVASNQPEWQRHHAMSIIHQEHLSLSAVINAMQFLVRKMTDGEIALEISLHKAILHYIKNFPETLHHPKEEKYLFSKIQEHTHEVDGVIAELERQHKVELKLVASLERALERLETLGMSAFAEYAQAVNAFSEAVWAHMSLEERLVFPVAVAHLSDEEWQGIAAAFAENGDPRFDRHDEQSYKKLFSRIMNLVPADTIHDDAEAARKD